ncbi:MAG: succinate dehydrogenase cytochrome b subunit [Bacteroides sp.]|nr:MAG: succinate dehydrogenase cytochrome b subunit [Bacteroides sp.]
MNTILNYSIGRKISLSLMGLFLCLFLIIHLIGNLKLFNNDLGLSFNQYSDFMSNNVFIKISSWILYFAILYHTIIGGYITYNNYKSRPIKYLIQKKNNISISSRNMGIAGSIIFIFIVVHMANFWWKFKFGNIPYIQYVRDIQSGYLASYEDVLPVLMNKNGHLIQNISNNYEIIYTYKNSYRVVSETFKNPFLVIFYGASMIAMSLHLLHGFKSAFMTLGLKINNLYGHIIHLIGWLFFGLLIPIGFASIPIYFYIVNFFTK